jgi:uncharacterized membrane protein
MYRSPLHPLLVHLPVGSWIAALILDLAFMANHNPLIASGSFCCILIGLVGAVIAAPAGIKDYLEISPHSGARTLARTHLLLNLGVVVLYSINLLGRFRQSHGLPSSVTLLELSLSIFAVFCLAVSGYVGGLLVFEYGLGTHPERLTGPAGHPVKRAA